MKTIFIIPILLLIFGVSKLQSAALDDCDENDLLSNEAKRSIDMISTKHPQQLRPYQLTQRSQQPEVLEKKSPYIRRQIKPRSAFGPHRRRLHNRMHQRPMLWPPKQKPILLKPMMPTKPLDPTLKHKIAEFYPAYPYKKQKRIKYIPAYDEYDTYPETDYVHEIVYPEPRAYDYVEVEHPSSYTVPCDNNESTSKDLSSEGLDNIETRDMDKSSEEARDKVEETTTTASFEKSSETEEQTEKVVEVTTLVVPVQNSTENIETRNSDTPTTNITSESITKFIQVLIRGIMALVRSIKSKHPQAVDMIFDILKNVVKSCNSIDI